MRSDNPRETHSGKGPGWGEPQKASALWLGPGGIPLQITSSNLVKPEAILHAGDAGRSDLVTDVGPTALHFPPGDLHSCHQLRAQAFGGPCFRREQWPGDLQTLFLWGDLLSPSMSYGFVFSSHLMTRMLFIP